MKGIIPLSPVKVGERILVPVPVEPPLPTIYRCPVRYRCPCRDIDSWLWYKHISSKGPTEQRYCPCCPGGLVPLLEECPRCDGSGPILHSEQFSPTDFCKEGCDDGYVRSSFDLLVEEVRTPTQVYNFPIHECLSVFDLFDAGYENETWLWPVVGVVEEKQQ